MSEFLSQMTAMSLWEAFATLLSVVYVYFAAKGNNWCWPAALVSTAIYTVLFYEVALLMESLLNAYYLAMAVYGWFAWRKAKSKNTSESTSKNNAEFSNDTPLPIVSWTAQKHGLTILGLLVTSLGLGYVMNNYTHADFAYLDTLTTVFAVFTTYLVAARVLENWLYWLVINSLSMYLYFNKSLYFVTGLMIVYTFVSIYGYIRWRNEYQQQHPEASALSITD